MGILDANKTKTWLLGAGTAALLMLSGCGSSDSSTSQTGVFQDSAVDGLQYRTASHSGTTQNGGKFTYINGETVSFYLGDLLLGAAAGKANMTPLDIVAGADGQMTTGVVNLLRLLQTLDSDTDLTNGITIPAAVEGMNFTAVDFSDEASVTALLNQIDNTLVLVTAEDAVAHFSETLASIGATINYIDYLGNTRTAKATAGAAEYHTGTGYGNTLFDSADNKCQNCHNELYDTWKGSMHGKSWEDPIFQSKFQDFLRTHLAKIGETKAIQYEQAEVGVGTKNMFSGAAQTCIKCHAPGAYYAGDVKVSVTELQDATALTTTELAALKTTHESNTPQDEIAVIAANKHQNKVYKATFQIGHEANREGINCAFCHSIETPRLMKDGGMDANAYTLLKDLRVGPHGPVKAAAGTALTYDVNASAPDMNKFFRLWGPEKYHDFANTAKNTSDFDVDKKADGRYTMTSKDLNGTNGKVHFTGGPFYGPYGVTGTSNENETDETNRTALVNPHYSIDGNNHFGNNGKGLCLSCHQRSAGAAVPSGEEGAGEFMELCSTQMAVTTGDDTGANDTLSSPKCQKCHMERIEGTVLHRWADPGTLWSKAVNPGLTAHFDPSDPDALGDENPVAAGWLNSHAFLGASKTGHKTSVTAKIKSGFEATLGTSLNGGGSTLTVTTTLKNKTAHMFPGAHPMRRVLTRVIVTDGAGNKVDVQNNPTGISTFGDITNTVQPLAGKTLHSSAFATVSVNNPTVNGGNAALSFPGKVPDLDGSVVDSQKFSGQQIIISGTDATISSQTVTNGLTEGNVTNAAIVVSSDLKNFTRIYGHETGKKYDHDGDAGTAPIFVVRPGFDSNMVENDTRLSPNETETYSIDYNINGLTGVSVTYKVYYMQKGANGKFITDATGFLDQAASDAKKLLVTEVYSDTVAVN